MINLRRLFSQNVIVLSLIIITLGCTSIPMEPQNLSNKIKNVQENIKIEGKLKHTYMNNNEKCYYVLRQTGKTS